MSTAYDYCPVNPTLRPRTQPQPRLCETVPLTPQRSEEFRAQVLTRLEAIKETLNTIQTTTAVIETRLTTVEKLTQPIYRAFRLLQGI